jgi:4-amino-4-deoxy-L-arabinose transferase-like glycosyltransferase
MSSCVRIKNMPDRPRLIKYLTAALLFLATFIIYIKTLCPVVPPWDSGELITAAYTLGIAHPPGYPLYVLLGKLFSLIPFGTIAWRVNLMSAFFASSAVTLAYFIILKLTRSALAGAVGSLFLAFSPIFWSMAVVAEVFQLNAFFAALTIYLLLMWKENKNFRWLLLFSFGYGLSLCNHHSMLLLAPGFLYFIWTNEKEVFFKFKNWAYLGLCFALGLLPYFYLPLRSLKNPYLDWGDPQTFERFWAVVTRAQYGSFRLDPAVQKSGSFLVQIKVYLGWLLQHFVFLGFFLGVLGMWDNIRNNRKLFAALLLLFLISGIGFMLMTNYPFDQPELRSYCLACMRKFMLLSFLIFSFWIGFGVSALEKWQSSKKIRIAIVVLLAILPLLALGSNYNKADKSGYYFAADMAENILLSLEQNSVIFPNLDTTFFSLLYLQGVEGRRPDVKIISTSQHKWRIYQIINQNPELVNLEIKAGRDGEKLIREKSESYPDGNVFLADVIQKNMGRIGLYSDTNQAPRIKPFCRRMAPNGLVYKILPDSSTRAKLANLEATEYLWNRYLFRSELPAADRRDHFAAEIAALYAESHNYAGIIYALSSQYENAEKKFKKSLLIDPGYSSPRLNLQRLRTIKKRP